MRRGLETPTFVLCILSLVLRSLQWNCDLPNSAKDNFPVGIDVVTSIPSVPFESALEFATDFLSLDFLNLHFEWTEIETVPNTTYVDPGGFLDYFDTLCRTWDIGFALTIRPIDMSGKTVPSDLESARFNSGEMIVRFKRVVDFVFSIMDPSILVSFAIGNEIDGYDTLGEAPTFWADYEEFLSLIRSWMNSVYPSVKVGFIAMFDGLVSQPLRFRSLASAVDFVGLTYYPHDSSFLQLRDPMDVAGDFDSLVGLYENVTNDILIQEAGYETSPLWGGSELKQAQFVCEMTRVMVRHSHLISSLFYLRLNDLSVEEAQSQALAYGLENDDLFLEFLRTLGFRNYDGTNKAALEVLMDFGFEVVESKASCCFVLDFFMAVSIFLMIWFELQ